MLAVGPSAVGAAGLVLAGQPSPYHHAGVVVFDDGRPFVYDITSDIDIWTKTDVLGEALVGAPARTPFLVFCRLYVAAVVFDPPPGLDVSATVRWLRGARSEKLPFDGLLDWEDPASVSCSELVARAYAAGGVAWPPMQRWRDHPEVARYKAAFGFEDAGLLPPGAFAAPERFVAAFGCAEDYTAARAFAAGLEELYRRFDAQQSVGNVVGLDGTNLRLRPRVAWFLNAAQTAFHGQPGPPPTPAEVDRRVRAIAAEAFGPYPFPQGGATTKRPAGRHGSGRG